MENELQTIIGAFRKRPENREEIYALLATKDATAVEAAGHAAIFQADVL